MALRLLDRPGPSMADQIAELTTAEREEWLRSFPEETLQRLKHDWSFWGRPSQQLPEPGEVGAWAIWLLLSGRGFGKTRTGGESIYRWTEEVPLIGILGPSAGDVRDVMIEGESGIMNIGHPDKRPKYEPSKRRLTFPNGCRATTFGAGEDPDELRGPQFYKAWLDELAAWQYAQEAVDNLEFGLRLGTNPQMIVTTTPKPKKVIREMLKDPDTVITKESSYANIGNLSPRYIKRVIRKYEGTRLGRQELHAELLDDVPGALWRRKDIRYRAHADLETIVVAVDPSVTTDGNAAGIIACGRDYLGLGYALGDHTIQASPLEWGKAAVLAYYEHQADRVIYEANQGGELVAQNIRFAAIALGVPPPPMTSVHASRGKRTRAEPVSNLYEQSRIFHARPLEALEDEYCNWNPAEDSESPNRLDAAVWGFTYLMVDKPDPVDDDYLKALRGMQVHHE